MTLKNRIAFSTILAMAATPALAHHPLGGAAMETFAQGLMSGVGHPILGFDHLFFVAAMGIAACFTGKRLTAPMFYLVGMMGGITLVVNNIALPATELLIAASLLFVGGIVLSGKSLSLKSAAVVFSLAGVFHGWAFGESIAGVEAISMAVICGYLIGLSATQWLIAVAAGYLATNFWQSFASTDIRPRLSGAVAAGVGATFFLEQLESVAFTAMGIG